MSENIETKAELIFDDSKEISDSRRIESLDMARGLSMIFIIVLHYAIPWFHENSFFIAGIGQLLLEFFGPSMFIILSTLAVVFNIKRKEQSWSEKKIRNNTFMRALMIIVIGFIYSMFSLYIWAWNILIFIGFSQIFSYYALKLEKVPRIIIGIIILLASEFVREFFWVTQNDNVLCYIMNFLLSSQSPDITILPWLAVCFIVPVFGEMLYDLWNKGTADSYRDLFKKFMMWGFILIILGVFFGLELKTPLDPVLNTSITYNEPYPYIELLDIWNMQKFAFVPALPKFLITGTSANILFNLGLDLIAIALLFKIVDINKKKNLLLDVLKFYGSVSLTLFLIEYLFIPLYVRMFSVFPFFLFVFPFAGFLGILMFIWSRYFGQVGTLEWLVGFVLKGKKKKRQDK